MVLAYNLWFPNHILSLWNVLSHQSRDAQSSCWPFCWVTVPPGLKQASLCIRKTSALSTAKEHKWAIRPLPVNWKGLRLSSSIAVFFPEATKILFKNSLLPTSVFNLNSAFPFTGAGSWTSSKLEDVCPQACPEGNSSQVLLRQNEHQKATSGEMTGGESILLYYLQTGLSVSTQSKLHP